MDANLDALAELQRLDALIRSLEIEIEKLKQRTGNAHAENLRHSLLNCLGAVSLRRDAVRHQVDGANQAIYSKPSVDKPCSSLPSAPNESR